MLLRSMTADQGEFEQRTGWALKPEGACKAEVCVPLPGDAVRDGAVDIPVVAERLGMPVVADEAHGLWAVGPETVTGRALATAVAPDIVLPDLDGNPFRLSTLHGRKVLLVAWASW